MKKLFIVQRGHERSIIVEIHTDNGERTILMVDNDYIITNLKDYQIL